MDPVGVIQTHRDTHIVAKHEGHGWKWLTQHIYFSSPHLQLAHQWAHREFIKSISNVFKLPFLICISSAKLALNMHFFLPIHFTDCFLMNVPQFKVTLCCLSTLKLWLQKLFFYDLWTFNGENPVRFLAFVSLFFIFSPPPTTSFFGLFGTSVISNVQRLVRCLLTGRQEVSMWVYEVLL